MIPNSTPRKPSDVSIKIKIPGKTCNKHMRKLWIIHLVVTVKAVNKTNSFVKYVNNF